MPGYFTHVVCLECGHEMPADLMVTACPACSSGWIDARYDYAAVAKLWPEALRGRPGTLWRYGELLPIAQPDPEISMGEGYSALLRLYAYERMFGHEGIYIKDERQGPTSSFKDRQAAMAVTAMKMAGITECVLASTGNAGAAYAAYCARAGIKLWLFLTSLVPAEKMREAALYGAEVVKVSGTYDETKKVAAEFARRRGIHLDKGARAIPGKESMKTLAFEIAEQLGLERKPFKNALTLNTDSHSGSPSTLVGEGLGVRGQPRFAAPDWYIQAVSGGIGPLGVWKGFSELHRLGLIDHLPRLGIVQAAGCAPMVNAWAAGKEAADPVIPRTLITVLATGDPGFSYTLLRQAVESNGGAMIAIEDGDTFAAMRKVASRAGLSVEPATAVAFAGLEKMLTDGIIKPGQTVVVNCSGHTFPAESHVLGDQYVLNLKLSEQAESVLSAKRESDGLSAALEHLDEQVTTILVVDDTLNDRRLIRRLLQRYKNYRVYEAHSGVEALRMVRERRPDLIVADLTMPEMDGFTLLEHLKNDSETAAIPVVVVSAKSLTDSERELLARHSESVWTKGGFDTRALVDHVVRTLGDTPAEMPAAKPRTSLRHDDVLSRLPKVVIIEDNPADSRLARRFVETSGEYSVIEAASGRDGLKAVYEHHPDLVLLDLLLPDIDGFSVLDALKSSREVAEIPVVVITGRDLTAEEQDLLQGRIHKIFMKSALDRNQICDIIKDVLR